MQSSFKERNILENLKENLLQNRVHHAYVFAGASGVGKEDTAKQFAALLINAKSVEATVARIERNGHPDLAWINPEDDLIKVDHVRDLPKILSFAPLEGKYRVVVINQAHLMNAMAANAILKVLEEPPSYVVFILICTDKALLLQTIVSRCQVIRFSPLGRAALEEKLADVDAGADLSTAITWSEGSLTRAKSFLESTEAREWRKKSRDILLKLWQSSPRITSEALRFAEELTEDAQINITLDTWLSLSRDVAILLLNESAELLYHHDARAELATLVTFLQTTTKNRLSVMDLQDEFAKKTVAIHRLRVALRAHGNQRAQLDKFICDMQIISIGK